MSEVNFSIWLERERERESERAKRPRTYPLILCLWDFRDQMGKEGGAVTIDEFREFIDLVFQFLEIEPTAENRKALHDELEVG